MARYYATQYFTGDGQTTRWNISFAGARPDTNSGTTAWFKESDVKAATIVQNADGTETETALTVSIVGPTQVDIVPAVAKDVQFKVYRESEREYPLVDFQDYSALTAAELDEAFRQTLFGVQELSDLAAYSALRSSSAYVLATSARDDAAAAKTSSASAEKAAVAAKAEADIASAEAQAAAEIAKNSDAGTVVARVEAAERVAGAAAVTSQTASGQAATAVQDSAAAKQQSEAAAAATAALATRTASLEGHAAKRYQLTDFPVTTTEEARLSAALAKVNTTGGELYIPAGTYRFTGTASCTLDTGVAIYIEAGAILSQTVDADLLQIQCSSFGQLTVRGSGQIWSDFQGKSTSAAALRVNYGVVRLSDFTLWQSTKAGSFRYGIHLTDVQTPTIRDLSLNDDSDALHTTALYATTSTHFSVDWSIRNVGTFGLREAFRFEANNSPSTTIEGVKLQHCYMVGCLYGVVWNAPRHAPMLTLDTCHINTRRACVDVTYGLEVQVNNCVMYRYGDTGYPFIQLNNSQDVQIVGGKMSNTDTLIIPYVWCTGLTAFLRMSDLYVANNQAGCSILKVDGDASKLYVSGSVVNGAGTQWLDLTDYTGPRHAIELDSTARLTPYDVGVTAVPTLSVIDGAVDLGPIGTIGYARIQPGDATTITKFNNGVLGRLYTIVIDSVGVTIPHAAGTLMSGDTPYICRKAGESITLRQELGGVREVGRSNPMHVKYTGSVSVAGFTVAAGVNQLVATVYLPNATASDVADVAMANQDRTNIILTGYCVGQTLRIYAAAPSSGARTLPASTVVYTVRAPS